MLLMGSCFRYKLVTNLPKDPIITPSVRRNLRTNVRAADLVAAYVSDEFVTWIVGFVNSKKRPYSGIGRRPQPFTKQEFHAIWRMHAERINYNGDEDVDEYLRSSDRLGYFELPDKTVGFVNVTRYNQFVSLLDFRATDLQRCFQFFNESFLSMVNTWPGGEDVHVDLAGDESMIEWDGTHAWKVYIPRKPCPNGIRVYVIASVFSSTGRPIVMHMIPDVFDSSRIPYKVMAVSCCNHGNLYANIILHRLSCSI